MHNGTLTNHGTLLLFQLRITASEDALILRAREKKSVHGRAGGLLKTDQREQGKFTTGTALSSTCWVTEKLAASCK